MTLSQQETCGVYLPGAQAPCLGDALSHRQRNHRALPGTRFVVQQHLTSENRTTAARAVPILVAGLRREDGRITPFRTPRLT